MTTWIFNASPLILLGKISRLNLLEEICPSFSIPAAVALEILAGFRNVAGYSAESVAGQYAALYREVVGEEMKRAEGKISRFCP